MIEMQWVIGLAGLCFTAGATLFATGRWVGASEEQMRTYVETKVGAERDERAKSLARAVAERDEIFERMRRDWTDSQKSQDNAFGEVGLSLRRAIDDMKDENHKREMWGRDNYVKKEEVDSMREEIKGLRSDIRELINEIKQDFKDTLKDLKSELAGRA